MAYIILPFPAENPVGPPCSARVGFFQRPPSIWSLVGSTHLIFWVLFWRGGGTGVLSGFERWSSKVGQLKRSGVHPTWWNVLFSFWWEFCTDWELGTLSLHSFKLLKYRLNTSPKDFGGPLKAESLRAWDGALDASLSHKSQWLKVYFLFPFFLSTVRPKRQKYENGLEAAYCFY